MLTLATILAAMDMGCGDPNCPNCNGEGDGFLLKEEPQDDGSSTYKYPIPGLTAEEIALEIRGDGATRVTMPNGRMYVSFAPHLDPTTATLTVLLGELLINIHPYKVEQRAAVDGDLARFERLQTEKLTTKRLLDVDSVYKNAGQPATHDPEMAGSEGQVPVEDSGTEGSPA